MYHKNVQSDTGANVMPDEREKKERVLHTRIPESLDEEIREHANQLGLSVSNLVRNVLQNAVGLVDDIIADTARTATGGKVAPRPKVKPGVGQPGESGESEVLGWQEAILEKNAVCDRCNAILEKGSHGAIAILEGAGRRPIRCIGCVERKNDGNA